MNEAFYRETMTGLQADIKRAEIEESELEGRLSLVRLRLGEMRKAAGSIARILSEMTGDPAFGEIAEGKAGVRHADIAERVLRDIGRPLRVPEIGRRMTEMGHHLPSDQRLRDSAIFSALKRRPHVFVKAKRGLWALKEWGLEGDEGGGSLGFDAHDHGETESQD